MGNQFRSKDGNLNHVGRRGALTVASDAAAPLRIDEDRRLEIVSADSHVVWTMLRDNVDSDDTIIGVDIADVQGANQPDDVYQTNGLSQVELTFYGTDEANETYLVYIALWPSNDGAGRIAIKATVTLGALATALNPADGTDDSVTYYTADIIVVDDTILPTVPYAIYNTTNQTAALRIDTMGLPDLTCQLNLTGGTAASASVLVRTI